MNNICIRYCVLLSVAVSSHRRGPQFNDRWNSSVKGRDNIIFSSGLTLTAFDGIQLKCWIQPLKLKLHLVRFVVFLLLQQIHNNVVWAYVGNTAIVETMWNITSFELVPWVGKTLKEIASRSCSNYCLFITGRKLYESRSRFWRWSKRMDTATGADIVIIRWQMEFHVRYTELVAIVFSRYYSKTAVLSRCWC